MEGWDALLRAARAPAIGALMRYFRDLDTAEEAFQEACLRALRSWPEKGTPRDPVSWLVFVGRNAGVDESRRRRRVEEMPLEEPGSGTYDGEAEIVEEMDNRQYRDDVLRLLFICCRPELPVAQQIALALRIVAGLSVAEIARAFLVAPSAMEKRITRAKQQIVRAGVAFSTPSTDERAERLDAVATMVYLIFNEGYSTPSGESRIRLCEEAIRLARLLLRLFSGQVELMGLLALCLLQHSRSAARLDDNGEIVLLEEQDRSRWDAHLIAEGLVLVEKALRRGRPGPFQVQAAIAAVHAQARRPQDTDWAEIDRLYGVLERLQPSPVVSLNRAVAVSKSRGAVEALAFVEPLSEALGGYFHFHGVRGALLAELGYGDEARVALERAIELARTSAEVSHLRRRLNQIEKS